MNIHFARWKTNNIKEFYSNLINKISNDGMTMLYAELYNNNKKNNNDYDTIGSINFKNDGKYEISVATGIDGKELIDSQFNESKHDVEKYCYIVCNHENKESFMMRILYPWIDTCSKIPVNYIFDNYNPPAFLRKIKDRIELELIIKLMYGKLRESILQQSMLPNSRSIININIPDGIYVKENVVISNIYDPIIFGKNTGISLPLDRYEEKLDIIVVFQYIMTNENSYYSPLVLQKYKCLKNIENRRKLFENLKIKECNTYSNLQYLYNQDEVYNEHTQNKYVDIKEKIIIPNDTFYITNPFGELYYDKGKVMHNQQFNKDITSKIKNKQQTYANSDKNKFGNTNTLSLDEVCKLLWIYNYKCDQCGINVCINYNSDCPNQFSIDRINDNTSHTFTNCRLTCLQCNRLHKKYELFTDNDDNSSNFIYCGNIDYTNIKCSCIKSTLSLW